MQIGSIFTLTRCSLTVVGAGLIISLSGVAHAGYIVTNIQLLSPPLNQKSFSPQSVAHGQVVGTSRTTSNINRATLWNGSGNAIDITPTTCISASAGTTNGTTQGGSGIIRTSNVTHAMLWSGSSASAVDLHPSGYTASAVLAITADGSKQAGVGRVGSTETHALMWQGIASSVVDLHLGSAYVETSIRAMDGDQQAGYASKYGGLARATLWQGTVASAVDLQPDAYSRSEGYGVGSNSQVGYGILPADPPNSGPAHALLWRGTKESAVDLHPDWLDFSWAFATNGVVQAGRGFSSVAGNFHAVAWTGSADSAEDLHLSLPPGFSESRALSVGVDGEVYGFARDLSLNWNLVTWTNVPEPASGFIILFAALALTTSRRK